MRETKVVEIHSNSMLQREVIDKLTSPQWRAKHGKLLAVDTETNGFDPLSDGARLLLVQIGVPGITWVVNACKCDVSLLKEVLEDTYWLCVLQNAKFDYKWLKVHAGIELQRMYDTQIAELLLISGTVTEKTRLKKSSLRAIVAKYLDIDLEKATRKTFVGHKGDNFSEEQVRYAAEDIPHLFPIQKKQTAAMKDAQLLEVARIEFRCLPAVGDMELNGLRVDIPQYREVIERSREQMKVKSKVLSRVIIEGGAVPQQRFDFDDGDDSPPINLQSNKKLLKVFHHFGLNVDATDEKTIKGIDHPLVRALLDYREWVKRVTTYGENVLEKIHPVYGRLYAEFLQLGSDAGRFSCVRPNLQQIPATHEYRGCFIAEAGHKLIKGDWSQFELRILAEFSGDPGMVEAFHAGLDMHSDTAARMFGIPYEKIDKKGIERQAAKILNFALCYGMGKKSLAAALSEAWGRVCTPDEAQEKMDLWFAARPLAGEWLKQAGKDANTYGECRTLANRRRLFMAPPGSASYSDKRRQRSSIERKGKNTPIQGSNGDMLKIGMRLVRDRLREAGIVGDRVGLVACVHDEIVIEVPDDRAAEAEVILSTCMREAGEVYLHKIPVVTETACADYWVK